MRCLKNKFARTVRKLEGDVAANGDELEAMYAGSLKRAVDGDVDNAFEATVDEMAEGKGAKTLVMACACASNVPGGGAIANAEVSGVSLEAIAQMAGA